MAGREELLIVRVQDQQRGGDLPGHVADLVPPADTSTTPGSATAATIRRSNANALVIQ